MKKKKEKQAVTLGSSSSSGVGSVLTVPLSRRLAVESGYKVYWGKIVFKFMLLAVACAVVVLVLVSAGVRDTEVFMRRDAQVQPVQSTVLGDYRLSVNGKCFEDESKVVVDSVVWCGDIDG